MNNELEIRNLRLSFSTNKGQVKAVRDISLNLAKGETLAIVGESGSGKSVTAKALLGIEAPNCIIENGEIIYHGEDILKYSEEDFQSIRGNKITMIYQDPLSSLDPIVKIGKQMTEASILNGKTKQKQAKKDYTVKLAQLKSLMLGAGIQKDEVETQIKTFKSFNAIGNKLLRTWNSARDYAEGAVFSIAQLQNDFHSDSYVNIKEQLRHLKLRLTKVFDDFFLPQSDVEFLRLIKEFNEEIIGFKNGDETAQIALTIQKISDILQQKLSDEGANFFCLGYYLLCNKDATVDASSSKELNKMLYEFINTNFMKKFAVNVSKALKYSDDVVKPIKKAVLLEIEGVLGALKKNGGDVHSLHARLEKICHLTNKSRNTFDLNRYAIVITLKNAIEKNYKKFEKGDEESKEEARESIIKILNELYALYVKLVSPEYARDYDKRAIAMIDYFKDRSYAMINRVTKQMAYLKAIRIMEEVGIKEPQKRFNQYPFEFSGGMRQRIVIAIAIAANPDLLICDEPTTALDVTIQAQIIELIKKIKNKHNMSVIFITHDLGVVANIADRVAVMYAGKIVETGTVDEIFYEPQHPYTWALLGSMPDLDTKEKLESIPGTPPNMIYPPKGDAFADRNKYAMSIDFEEQPPLFKVSKTHYAATWLLHPDAPKINPPQNVVDRIERMKNREVVNNGK